jgi:hypothetical protein
MYDNAKKHFVSFRRDRCVNEVAEAAGMFGIEFEWRYRTDHWLPMPGRK